MKKTNIALLINIFGVVVASMASDRFPVFLETPFTIQIPTNTVGFQSDPSHIVGSNVAYTLIGQIFTNSTDGHIQTLAEGFSGTNTDKTTPWKTLTQLLAAYQQNVDSNAIASLYSSDSQPFLDLIYTNSTVLANYKSFATAITGMTALMEYETTNGFIAVTAFSATNMSSPDIMPFYFTKSGNSYFLSSYDSSDARESNIGVFLNTHSVTNFLPK